jgi:hypothetical protein
MKKNNGIRASWMGLLLLTFFGCYEEKEGCLDVRATNFSFEADIPCPDCCEFPSLTVDIEHSAVLPDDTIRFRYDSLYYVSDFPDVLVSFQRIKYYISDFALVNSNGGQLTVTDSINFKVPDGTGDSTIIRSADNFILVDRDIPSDYELGRILGDGAFDHIQFKVGIDPALQSADPNLLPGGHPMRIQSDSLNWSEDLGYISNKIVFFREPGQNPDSTLLNILEPVEVTIPIGKPVLISPGFDISVSLEVDYLSWFQGLNLQTATEEEIITNIANHLSNSFSLLEVTF